MENVEQFIDHGQGVLEVQRLRPFDASQRTALAPRIGRKGAGLCVIPAQWTPPFFFIDAAVYNQWSVLSEGDRELHLLKTSAVVAELARRWELIWQRGLVIRSSATNETLRERGANTSVELAADYDAAMILRAIVQIYGGFAAGGGTGSMALAIQARVSGQIKGHISNEQRVSKTINQWMWEQEPAETGSGRFNSQREQDRPIDKPLTASTSRPSRLIAGLREVGRWATQLRSGRTHLEWGATGDRLWLYQLDFEDDQPDEGVDPTNFLREGDFRSSGKIPHGSAFDIAPVDGSSGWSKIDKTASFISCVSGVFPTLIYITGDRVRAYSSRADELIKDLRLFGHDRIVCRTDCRDSSIPSLNLPRTHTVSSESALAFMHDVVGDFEKKNVSPSDVCFILHRFIPSVTAAWAVARHNGHMVRVDSLWGLPDGLQYLPHDSYEYDLASVRQSTERLHYKHAFLQEAADGKWEVAKVARKLTRGRSLPLPDLAEISRLTQKIAQDKGADVQVMWFCLVPQQTGIARNIPWFSITPQDTSARHSPVSPTLRRFVVRSNSDLRVAESLPRVLLLLEPDDPELFRSQEFLDKIIDVARSRDFPVALTGSILAHAFYVLDKAGITVTALAEPTRNRARQRRVFRKLVRDEIPSKIERGGEIVTLAEIAKEEARAALVSKLFEEAFELLRADTPQDVTAELADLLEVVKALAMTTGVEWTGVTRAADAKRLARGGFDRNIVLLETSAPAWADGRPSSATAPIPLSRLGQITRSGETVCVSYPLLVSTSSPVTIGLDDGREIVIMLNGEGVRVTPVIATAGAAGQLGFEF